MKNLTVLFLFLLTALPARASEDCARLLITPDREFQSYAEELLDRVILETEDLLPLNYARILRSANRSGSNPDYGSNNVGFRLVRNTEGKARQGGKSHPY